MQTGVHTAYQAWMEAEMDCANGARRRKWREFWRAAGFLLATFPEKDRPIELSIAMPGFAKHLLHNPPILC